MIHQLWVTHWLCFSSQDKEDRSRRVRRRGSSASPGDRRRSRSRSFDRRRSRSRERDRARAWRNKSPPPSRRYERRYLV